MSPKEYRTKEALRQATKRLRAASFSTYCRVISRLLLEHREYEFLRPLSDALRAKDWKALVSHSDYLSKQLYSDATSHFVGNQFSLLIRKYPWDPSLIGTDPLKTAEQSFFSANKRCGRVNRKFELLQIDPSRDRFRKESKAAMKWIWSVLGSTPNYRNMFRKSDFGPGASLGVHGDATHILRKVSSEVWTVTSSALHHGFGGLLNNFHYLESILTMGENGLYCYDYDDAFNKYVARLRVVNNNKLGFVAKTVFTLRSVCTEPLINGFCQTGVDLEMRAKLKSAGIDLEFQDLNQHMALKGSLDDSPEGFVTVDIRNASNSVARGPIQYLYPDNWYRLFMALRSRGVTYKGINTPLEMMCSMGNGFCFPLETLTFAAICVACGCGSPGVDFMVYGDDIIIRKKHFARVSEMLSYYGYKLNLDKTFIEGPFRESCGADWYEGQDVRPFTLDFEFDSVEAHFKFLNLTQRNENCKKFFASVRTLVIESLPIEYRFLRPLKGEVDSGIDSLGDEHLLCPHCHYDKHRGAWTWKELAHRPVIDLDRLRDRKNEPWLIGIALRGETASITHGVCRGLPEVTFRRQTRTSVTRKSYSSTSNWLPTSQT